MRKVYEYSHLGGSEILQVRYPEINAGIDRVIADVTGLTKSKLSQEKTKKGVWLYAPKEINRVFKERFATEDFHELKDYYTIAIPGCESRIPGAFKQVDFVKDKVLVEVQFGKYAFMFYVLAKFQYFSMNPRLRSALRSFPATISRNRCHPESRTASSLSTTSSASASIFPRCR